MRAIKSCCQHLAAASWAPVPMFVSALICIINRTQKKKKEAKSWWIRCGKGSLGLDRGCCKSEGLCPLASDCRALRSLHSQNIECQHPPAPGQLPGSPALLAAAGRGTATRGTGTRGTGTRDVAGEGRAGSDCHLGMGSDRDEDLEKGNCSCLKEGKAGAGEQRCWGAGGAGGRGL